MGRGGDGESRKGREMAEGVAVEDGRRKRGPGRRGEPFPTLNPSGWWDRSASFRSHRFLSTLGRRSHTHSLGAPRAKQGLPTPLQRAL